MHKEHDINNKYFCYYLTNQRKTQTKQETQLSDTESWNKFN